MEINILIKRYSDLLTNLCFTLNRVLNNEFSDDSNFNIDRLDYFKKRDIFVDFILVEIAHCRKNIIYLQGLVSKKEFKHE